MNADDFGRSRGVNRGIIEAHERGIVTSASLMVRFDAAAEAAAYAREHRELSVGLHIDLGEWAYREGQWRTVYEVAPRRAGDVAQEIDGQLSTFRALVGDDPTHLDSHQHVHREEPVRSIVVGLGRELRVPVRDFSDRVRYDGSFFGQADWQAWPEGITPDALLSILRALQPGATELGCHPGYADDLASSYRAERAREVATLCDPRVRHALVEQQIELRSFREL